MKMNKNTIMTIVMLVLVLVSVVQAFQLNTLKTDIADAEGISISTGSGPAPVSGGGASGGSLPSSLDQLDNMVGGC
jgi:hypothetical protein